MPRLAGPPTTDSAKLARVLARIAVAQSGRGVANRFRQFRRGVASDWTGIDREGIDVAVHEYQGPSGRGYEVECWTVDRGVTWRRVANYGPETRRETAWTVVGGP